MNQPKDTKGLKIGDRCLVSVGDRQEHGQIVAKNHDGSNWIVSINPWKRISVGRDFVHPEPL